MATLEIEIPDDVLATVGRAYGVVQEPEETPAEAWGRLKAALIDALKRPVIQMRKREIAKQQQLTETYVKEKENV
jgi:hypothetical protein